MASHSSTLAWRIPVDRGAWWATVHGVTKSLTWLSIWAPAPDQNKKKKVHIYVKFYRKLTNLWWQKAYQWLPRFEMEVGGGISKEHKEIFMDEYGDYIDSFINVYVCHINIRLNKLCTQSVCCLWFVSYTSIKLFKKFMERNFKIYRGTQELHKWGYRVRGKLYHTAMTLSIQLFRNFF